VAEFVVLVVDLVITGDLEMTEVPEHNRKEAMSRDFQPSVRIGKTGVNDNIVTEIEDQLAKRKLVKIKINKGIYDRSARGQIWEHLSEQTNSVLVLARGNIAVLWRK